MTDLYLPPQSLAASNVSFESLDLSWAAVTQIRRTVTVPGNMPQNTKLMLHGDGNIADDMGLNTPSWYGTAGYTAGKFGQAMSFDGTNCVKIPYGPNVVFGANDFTIACWVKQSRRNGALGDNSRIFSHQFRYSSNYSWFGLRVEILGGNGVMAFSFQTAYSGETAISTSFTMPLNTWVHVAMVRHGSTISVYANGNQVGTSQVSGALYQNGNASFKVGAGTNEGASDDTPASLFLGQIDEFLVVNGSALWTSNFTPPTAPYSKTSSTEVIQPATPSGYKIYRDGALYVATAGTSYHASGLAMNTDYTWTVYAYDGNCGGELSTAVSTSTLDGYVIKGTMVVVKLGAEIKTVTGTVNGTAVTFEFQGTTWRAEVARSETVNYVVEIVGVDAIGRSTPYAITLKYGFEAITNRGPGTYYNASDLNRVENAAKFLSELLLEYGYYVTVLPRTDWTIHDLPNAGDMRRYLDNVQALVDCYCVLPTTPPLPPTMGKMGYRGANAIEQILADIHGLIVSMADAWYYADDIYSGEV